MSDGLEFASPEQVDVIREAIEERFAAVDLSGVEVTFCEEFTDSPDHLREPGEERVGWYLRVRDGQVEVGRRVVDIADARVVADYATTLPLARIVYGDDRQGAAKAAKLAAEASTAGRMRFEGDRRALARLPMALVHDDMARRTA